MNRIHFVLRPEGTAKLDIHHAEVSRVDVIPERVEGNGLWGGFVGLVLDGDKHRTTIYLHEAESIHRLADELHEAADKLETSTPFSSHC